MFYNSDIIQTLKQQIELLENPNIGNVEMVKSNLEEALGKLIDREYEQKEIDAKLNVPGNNTYLMEEFFITKKGQLIHWKM